tara:strand:- start:2542 stop:2811 length:270 start_codon:yes stop_codon:yes gene_type:complete
MKNKNIGMRSILIILASIGLVATIWYGCNPNEPVQAEEVLPINKDMWIPTPEDIAYQDSMYNIIQHTQQDVDTIKEHIEQIMIRLDDLD